MHDDKWTAPAPKVGDDSLEGEDAKRRFAKLDGRTNGVFLLLWIGLGLLVYFATRAMADLRMSLLPSAPMSFPMDGVFYASIGMFGGIGLAIMVVMPIMRRCWPEDSRWYVRYLSVKRYGTDYERLCYRLGMATVGVVFVALVLALNCYVQARDDAFVVHHYFALREDVHKYSDIKSIGSGRRHGRSGYRTVYVVEFKDGKTWDSDYGPTDDPYQIALLMHLLAERSGVKVEHDPWIF